VKAENQILGIGASPRIGANSDILLKQVLAGVKGQGINTEELHLRDYHYLPVPVVRNAAKACNVAATMTVCS
jgi:multimeric flavodoxin WrbA